MRARNNKIRTSRGDFGEVIPVELVACCNNCEIDLLDTDIIRLEIQKDEVPLVIRETTWATLKETDAVLPLVLTKEESEAMPIGVYSWTVFLKRAKDVGLEDGPAPGAAVTLPQHGGYCRVVPISMTKAILVWEAGGNAYAQYMVLEERVIPVKSALVKIGNGLIDGLALTGGEANEVITIQIPGENPSE